MFGYGNLCRPRAVTTANGEISAHAQRERLAQSIQHFELSAMCSVKIPHPGDRSASPSQARARKRCKRPSTPSPVVKRISEQRDKVRLRIDTKQTSTNEPLEEPRRHTWRQNLSITKTQDRAKDNYEKIPISKRPCTEPPFNFGHARITAWTKAKCLTLDGLLQMRKRRRRLPMVSGRAGCALRRGQSLLNARFGQRPQSRG